MSLSIDIETYSSADLKKSGVYAYVGAPDFIQYCCLRMLLMMKK